MKELLICGRKDCEFFDEKGIFKKSGCTILTEGYINDDECPFFKEKGTVDFEKIKKEVDAYNKGR